MKDMEKLCELIESELEKIAEKGLTTGNLDTAYKLVDMYKDLKDAEYRGVKQEYYEQEMMGGYSEADGYSEARRRRDSRGRYSRAGGMDDGESYADGGSSYARGGSRGGNRGDSRGGNYSRAGGYSSRDGGYSGDDRYERYMDSKQSYRNSGKSADCKQRLVDTLEDYMDDFSEKMEEMLRDADCKEERETISRYLQKIKSIA